MGKARVLYDGACAFCCKSVELAKKLDWLGKLEYVNVRDKTQPILREPLIAAAPLLEQMHVVPVAGDALYGGYRAVRFMAWRLPLLWPIAPFLYLPGMTWLGQKIYLYIARNRFKIIPCAHGACSLPPPKTAVSAGKP
jgi:predicted DCC family thiol-disulfide oxidoreductase YuxK